MSIFTKVTSLLNKALPIGLAYKGLQKINPKIARFLAGAAAAGYSTEEALDFMREKITPQQQPKQRVGMQRPDELAAEKEIDQSKTAGRAVNTMLGIATGLPGGVLAAGNELAKSVQAPKTSFEEFIKQNPALGRYMDGLMAKGASPEEAAKKAKGHTRFKKLVGKIEQDMGQDFISLIGQLLGKPSAPAQQQEAPQQDSGQDQDRFIYKMIRQAMGQQ